MYVAARDADALKLPFEGDAFFWKTRGDEWAAHAGRVLGCRNAHPPRSDLGENGTHAPCLRLIILLDHVKRCRLSLLDAIKRDVQARNSFAHAQMGQRVAALMSLCTQTQMERALVVCLRSPHPKLFGCAAAALPDG